MLSVIKQYATAHQLSYRVDPQGRESCPDIVVIDAEKSIKIDAIKGLQERLSYAPYALPHCFVLIPNCELLTTEAANAFLKTLEEPRENVIFFLSTSHLHRVPATIQSRCQLIYVPDFGYSDSLPETHVSFAQFMALSLPERFSYSQQLAEDKELAKQTCIAWLSDCVETACIEPSVALMQCLKRLQFNTNCRLQLESLSLALTQT